MSAAAIGLSVDRSLGVVRAPSGGRGAAGRVEVRRAPYFTLVVELPDQNRCVGEPVRSGEWYSAPLAPGRPRTGSGTSEKRNVSTCPLDLEAMTKKHQITAVMPRDRWAY